MEARLLLCPAPRNRLMRTPGDTPLHPGGCRYRNATSGSCQGRSNVLKMCCYVLHVNKFSPFLPSRVCSFFFLVCLFVGFALLTPLLSIFHVNALLFSLYFYFLPCAIISDPDFYPYSPEVDENTKQSLCCSTE